MRKETGIIPFMRQVVQLKTLDRAGWVKRGINNPESVSDHSFGVVILTLTLSNKANVDRSKCIEMAAVHDLAESVIKKDITPSDGVSEEEKRKLEEEAMITLCKKIDNGDEILSLWREFEEGKTPEAKFVKKLDKLEMMFQASEYGTTQPAIDLSAFWDGTEEFDFGELQEIYNELKTSR